MAAGPAEKQRSGEELLGWVEDGRGGASGSVEKKEKKERVV